MKKSLIVFSSLLIVAALAFTGCIEEKAEYSINPDGSGKVIYEIQMPSMSVDLELGDAGSSTSGPDLRAMVKEIILYESQGVDTWKDISFKLTDENQLHFKGTAYFPDITKLRIGDFSDGLIINRTDGRLTLELDINGEKKPEELTEQQIDELVGQFRQEYSQGRRQAGEFVAQMHLKSSYRFGGDVVSSGSFESPAPDTLTFELYGPHLLEKIDFLYENEDKLREIIRQTGTHDIMPIGTSALLFDRKRPEKAVVNLGTTPLFDYDAEVAQAKENYPKMMEKLQLAENEQNDEIKSSTEEPRDTHFSIAGTRVVTHTDRDKHIMPFNSFEPNISYFVVGELEEPVGEITALDLTKASTDQGQCLLSNAQTIQRIQNRRLHPDKQTVSFVACLDLPEPEDQKIENLAGTLELLTAGGTKEVDLGLLELAEGEPTQIEDYTVKYHGPSQWNPEVYSLTIKLDLPVGIFESATLYDENGDELSVRPGTTASSGGRLIHTGVQKDGPFPEKVHIVLNLRDDVVRTKLDFEFTDLPLPPVTY